MSSCSELLKYLDGSTFFYSIAWYLWKEMAQELKRLERPLSVWNWGLLQEKVGDYVWCFQRAVTFWGYLEFRLQWSERGNAGQESEDSKVIAHASKISLHSEKFCLYVKNNFLIECNPSKVFAKMKWAATVHHLMWLAKLSIFNWQSTLQCYSYCVMSLPKIKCKKPKERRRGKKV